jgi:hypothetical protein
VIWLLHKLGILRGVWLLDFQGDTYRTYMRETPFGRYAYVYPWTRVGNVALKEDGTTGGPSCYVHFWKPMT